jgi:tetratricopeptide (TPR) repeat protein
MVAQPVVDTSLIRQWSDSGFSLVQTDDVGARHLGEHIIAASGIHYLYGRLSGWQLIGESYYMSGRLDSALYYYRLALALSVAEHYRAETGNNHTALASILQEKGDLDSAMLHYDKAIGVFSALEDSFSLSDAMLRRGNVQSSLGHHDAAMASFLACLRISEALDRKAYIGYSYGSMGIIYDKQGDYAKAETYFLKALEIFRSMGNIYGQISYTNNLGILHKNTGEYDKAMAYYVQCLALSDSIGYDRGRLSAHTNMGLLLEKTGYFENALHHAARGLSYADSLQAKEPYADNLNTIARAHLGLKQYQAAREYAEASLLWAPWKSSVTRHSRFQTLPMRPEITKADCGITDPIQRSGTACTTWKKQSRSPHCRRSTRRRKKIMKYDCWLKTRNLRMRERRSYG